MIKPIGQYILVEPDKMPEQTKSGIFLPEETREKLYSGIVIEGNDIVDTGIKVYYRMWAGETIKHKDEEYLLIHKRDLVARG